MAKFLQGELNFRNQIEIKLTEDCHCHYPNECNRCGGKGEILTENGQTILDLVEKFFNERSR